MCHTLSVHIVPTTFHANHSSLSPTLNYTHFLLLLYHSFLFTTLFIRVHYETLYFASFYSSTLLRTTLTIHYILYLARSDYPDRYLNHAIALHYPISFSLSLLSASSHSCTSNTLPSQIPVSSFHLTPYPDHFTPLPHLPTYLLLHLRTFPSLYFFSLKISSSSSSYINSPLLTHLIFIPILIITTCITHLSNLCSSSSPTLMNTP